MVNSVAGFACLDCGRYGKAGAKVRWPWETCRGVCVKVPAALRSRLLAGEFDEATVNANALVRGRLAAIQCIACT